jgi:signal transduction histidine kinase
MTSVIAHEINNPLEAITNLMYLLRNEFHGEGPALGYIAMVESELERISGITKQTLRWNRETSELAETFYAGYMVDEVLRLFAGKIRNRQIAIKTEGMRDLPMRRHRANPSGACQRDLQCNRRVTPGRQS